MMWRLVWRLKERGSRAGFMLASCGNWLPLRRLQGWQQATRFSQVERPPRERGMTWSSVSSPDRSVVLQYWQVLRSRSKMFLRERARDWCGIRRYSSRRMTDGTRMATRAACRKCPFSSSVMAMPLSTSTMARRAAQTLIGSYEAAEAQEKVCDIHYKQMEKADRDPMHALRAEQECKTLITQFPNSKFAPLAQQKLRDIQEVLAESEFRVGKLYEKKGSFPAAANRFQALADQFPIYSNADEALWQLAESYHRMGDRFEEQQATAYQRIVKDYPLSIHAEDARAQLEVMKRTVPEADTVAMARMKYEMEN